MVVENGILVRVTNEDIVNGKFEFPAGVTSIDDDAFWGCSSLKEIIIPSNVSIIGNSVFAWCDQLEKVVILGNVTSVGSDLFLLCESLKEISIEKIDDINFYYNVILHAKSLKNITIQGVKLSYDEFVDLFSTITTNPTLAVFAFKEKKFISQNPFITKFTPESEIENFYRNSKAWKDLVQEYTKKHNHLSESDLLIAIGTIYKLCIALGFFHEEKQNEVKTFLYNNIFEINPYDLQDLVGELPTARCGYNEEFAKFFMKNFHLPLDYEDENSYHVNVPFLCRWDSKRCKLVNLVATVYEEWEQVKQVYPYKTVMADRETESENNNLTEDDVLSVFAKKVYKNVLPGNEELAELCGPYFYSDSDFEELQQWYEESKKIKKEDMILSVDEDEATAGITYELLDKDNPRATILGELTNCCQVVDDQGKECLKYGMTKLNSGFVEFKHKGNIIGQSWVWYNSETQIVCLDNIEIPVKVRNKIKKNKVLYNSFVDCLKRLADGFYNSMISKGYPVKGVTIGDQYTKLNMLGDHFEAFNPIEKFGEKCLPEDYNNKYSDATNKQYMVCDYTKRNILEI